MPEDTSFLHEYKLLTANEIYKIAEIFVLKFGISKIRFTGGEPLIRSDAGNIMELISQLPVELAVTTNGILLDRFLPLFKKIGLTSINVSLDSLIPEKFFKITKHQEFQSVKNNIDIALREGFKIKVNMVVMKDVNDDEILDFAEWTLGDTIHVRFIEFMPFMGNNWEWNKVISYKKLKKIIERLYCLDKLYDKPNATSKSYRIKGAIGTLAFISTVTEPFCESCNRLRLTADGKMQNCLFARNEVDLLSALRKGIDINDLILSNIRSKEAAQGGKSPCEKVTEKSMVFIGG